jgi:hypothetical protein
MRTTFDFEFFENLTEEVWKPSCPCGVTWDKFSFKIEKAEIA